MKPVRMGAGIVAALSLALTGAAPAGAAPDSSPLELHSAPGAGPTGCAVSSPCSIDEALRRAESEIEENSRPPVILLHRGTYSVKEGLVVGARAAGLRIEAYGDGEPVIDGGQPVTGWASAPEVGAGVFKATLPEGTQNFRQLYDNGERQVIARYPDRVDDITGGPYLRLPEQSGANSPATCMAAGAAAPGAPVDCMLTIPAVPAADGWWNGAQIAKADHWRYKELNLAGATPTADGEHLQLSFAPATATSFPQGFPDFLWSNAEPVNSPYFLQDSLAFLNADREWYYDEDARTLYYKPSSKSAPSDRQVVVPQVEKLLTISGTHDVSVSGITFQNSNWSEPATVGYATNHSGQPLWTAHAATTVPGAIMVSSGENVSLTGNVLRRTAAHAIVVDGVSTRLDVSGNRITDTSGGGISLYAGTRAPKLDHQISRARVTGNVISEVGQHYADSAGISGTHVCDTRIERNDVSYARYAGISLGLFTNGEDENRCEATSVAGPDENNLIRYNRVSNTMLLLDDGGAIYALGRSPGTLISENFVSGVQRTAYSGNNPLPGVYIDDSGKDYTIERNVLNVGKSASLFANRDTARNVFTGNWHTGALGTFAPANPAPVRNVQIEDGAWPTEALAIIAAAGLPTDSELRTPLVITSPVPGFVVTEDQPVFAGTATPGNRIEVRGAVSGTVIASATAASDGRWSAVSSVLPDGKGTRFPVAADPYRFWANEISPDAKVVERRLLAFTRIAPTIVTSPTMNERVDGPVTSVAGTATPNARIEVRGVLANTVLGTAVADAAGNWSASIPGLPATRTGMPYSLNAFVFAGTARIDTAMVTFERLVTPVAFTSPGKGATTTGAPTFAGTGEPGATVIVKGSTAGTTLGTTTVGHDGTWRVTSMITLAPQAMAYDVQATQTLANADVTFALLSFVVAS